MSCSRLKKHRTYAKLSQQGAATTTVRAARLGAATRLGRFCVSPETESPPADAAVLSAIEATLSQGGFERVVSTATQNPVNTQATAKPIFVYLPADLPQLSSVRQQLIAIAIALGKPTLAVIRGASQTELSQWQAEHIQAQATHVDMAHALANANVLITHAGHSTVCQALLAGVPMVLIPRSLETRHTAIAAVNAGAAVIAGMPEGDDSVINDLAGSIEQAKALTHPRARRQASLDPAKAGEASGSNIKGANGQTTNEAEG